MKAFFLAAAGSLVGALSVSEAQLPSPLPEFAAQPGQVDHAPAATVALPNGVTGLSGITYASPTGYRPLTLDLFLPPKTLQKPRQGFPLIVFIHGGGWLGGDSRHCGAFLDFPGVLASLAQRGYVVASLNYRLSGEAKFPAPIQDVKAAIRWLRSRASQYALDPRRAMTWGASAGGHLAALAAVSGDVPALEPPRPERNPTAPDGPADPSTSPELSDRVQGGVIWYGVYDFATLAAQAREAHAMSRDVPDAPEWQMLGCYATGCKDGQLAAASPVTYVNPKAPPMLLIVGDKDTTVPYHQTLEMAQKLKTAGVPTELMVLPNIDHSFIGKTFEQTRDANLKALAATFAFIDQVMGAAASTGQGG